MTIRMDKLLFVPANNMSLEGFETTNPTLLNQMKNLLQSFLNQPPVDCRGFRALPMVLIAAYNPGKTQLIINLLCYKDYNNPNEGFKLQLINQKIFWNLEASYYYDNSSTSFCDNSQVCEVYLVKHPIDNESFAFINIFAQTDYGQSITVPIKSGSRFATSLENSLVPTTAIPTSNSAIPEAIEPAQQIHLASEYPMPYFEGDDVQPGGTFRPW